MKSPFVILPGGKIECRVCPHLCKIAEGKSGICGVRINNGGKPELLSYGAISGLAVDPVEKKPLYHYYPGYRILSVGSWGCNMRCDFCQNYHISQEVRINREKSIPPSALASKAMATAMNIGIAYTYNEPAIWYEYVMDTAKLVKSLGMKNVMVTNGFITPDILSEYLTVTDAFNVDLKAFNDRVYRELTGAGIDPVKKALQAVRKAGKHLEITTLVIPGRNDSSGEMEEEVKWIAGELGKGTPLHLSRYFPVYRRDDPATPEKKLAELRSVASEYLDYVYIGNSASDAGQDTNCPRCGQIITERRGYEVRHINTSDGRCNSCGETIYPDFTFSSSSKYC